MIRKAELLKVTVDDLDGGASFDAPPVNIMREKTFNPELSKLLNRIYTHEKAAVDEPSAQDFSDPGYRNSLIERCDRLIYMLKHKAESEAAPSEFNPFLLDVNVYDEIDDLNEYIQAGMSQIGFERFALLKYNFRDAAFRAHINRINADHSEDLFLSIKDPLFRHIFERKEGCIIHRSSIIEDPFLNKKFAAVFNSDNSGDSIYFVRLSSFFDYDDEVLFREKGMNSFEQYLLPVIAIVTGHMDGECTPFSCFDKIKRNMHIPLSVYAAKNRLSIDSAGFSYEDALFMVELFIDSPAGREMSRSIITLADFSAKENIFILKYLMSRIRKRLGNDSFFMRVSIDKCVLIAPEEERQDVLEMIEEVNSMGSIIKLESAGSGSDIERDFFTMLFF